MFPLLLQTVITISLLIFSELVWRVSAVLIPLVFVLWIALLLSGNSLPGYPTG